MIPSKGSGEKFGVWSVMRKSETDAAVTPATETVSAPERSVSAVLFPTTGVVPTPVPKTMVFVSPPSTKEILACGSNRLCVAQFCPQSVPDASQNASPVHLAKAYSQIRG